MRRAGQGSSATNQCARRTAARTLVPATDQGSAGAGWGTRGRTVGSVWPTQDVLMVIACSHMTVTARMAGLAICVTSLK